MRKTAMTTCAACVFIMLLFTNAVCKKAKELMQFQLFLKSKEIPITIPVSPAGAQMAGNTFVYDVNEDIASQNTTGERITMDNVIVAKVNKLAIEVVSGATTTNNFANFTNGNVIFASDGTASSQSQTTLASIQNIPDVFATRLDFTVDGATDVKEYLKGRTFVYQFFYNLRRPITVPIQAVIKVEWDLKIQR